jgi:hypothetical protein
MEEIEAPVKFSNQKQRTAADILTDIIAIKKILIFDTAYSSHTAHTA